MEVLDHLLHHDRLRGQLLAGGRGLLAGGGVGLDHGGDLIHAGGQLGDGFRLGDGVFCQFIHVLNGCAGTFHGLLHIDIHILGQLAAPLHGAHGGLNELFGLLGGVIGLGSQVAHLVCHHGEALAGISGTGGLHGGVQGQNVGLEGDILDGLDDLADVLLALEDLAHGLAHLLHPLVADADLVGGLIGLFLGGLGGLTVGLGGVVQVVDGGGKLLYRAGLLRGSLGQSLGTGGDLISTGGHLVGSLQDTAHGVIEVGQQEFDIFLDGSQLAGILLRHGTGQVAGCQTLGDGNDVLNGAVQNALRGADSVADAADFIFGLIGNTYQELNTGSANIQKLSSDLAAEIEKYNTTIRTLQAEINHYNTLIGVGAGLVGSGLFIGVVGSALCFAFPVVGGIGLALGIGMVIGGGVTWGVMQSKINKANQDIQNLRNQIAADRQTVVALNTLGSAADVVLNSAQNAISNMTNFAASWATLGRSLQATYTALEQGGQEAYSALLALDLDEAEGNWNDVKEYVKKLSDVDPKVEAHSAGEQVA